MGYREKYLAGAIDGKPRTPGEICEMIGLESRSGVSQFLHALKFNLTNERSEFEIIKAVGNGTKNTILWTLAKRTKKRDNEKTTRTTKERGGIYRA